jgi:short-subunit dehydrogenase
MSSELGRLDPASGGRSCFLPSFHSASTLQSSTMASTRPWAIITGASEGIGVGFAECIDKRQTHNIVLVARTKAKLEAVAKKLTHVETRIIVEDLSKAGAAETILEKTKDLKVALLINNAGMAPGGNHEEVALETVQKTMALNMTTPAELMSLIIPELKEVRESLKEQQAKSKYGLSGIINIGSMSAFFPIPSMALYAATKAFLLSFSESLYQEQRNIGSDLPIICSLPGPVQSEIWTKVSQIHIAMIEATD